MKFLALFAAGAAASTIVARQADQIAADVETISSNTAALSDGVSSFDGSPDAVIALQQASETLISSIQAATSNLPTEELAPADATNLVTPFTQLRQQVIDSIDGVIAQEQAFVDANVAGIVYDQLTQIRAASQALSDGILAIVPEGLREIAQGLSGPILDNLDRGVSAFEQYADQDGGSSSSAGETTSAEETATETETVTETSVVPTGTAPPVVPTETPTGSIPPYDVHCAHDLIAYIQLALRQRK